MAGAEPLAVAPKSDCVASLGEHAVRLGPPATAAAESITVIVNGRHVPINAVPPEFWRDLDLHQLRSARARLQAERREQDRLYWAARYTAEGDPDATAEQVREAKAQTYLAGMAIAHIEDEQRDIERDAERLRSTLLPASGRPPADDRNPAPAPVRIRVARPREHRPGRRRRAASRTGPGDDSSDSDGEGPHVGRRRRGRAP